MADNYNGRSVRQRSERTVMAWLSENMPGDTALEVEAKTGLNRRTITEVLKSLVGRGKVIKTPVKKRVPMDSYVNGHSLPDFTVPEAGIRHTTVREFRYCLKAKTTNARQYATAGLPHGTEPHDGISNG